MTFEAELRGLLKEELGLLEKLRDISSAKAQVLADSNITELSNITRKEEVLVGQVVELENARLKLLDTWGIAMETSISDLINKLSESENTDQLASMQEELQEVMEDLRVRNEANAKLLQANLDWVDFNINFITSAETPTPYGQGNENSKGNKIFDRKV